jgi:hypothetical protein
MYVPLVEGLSLRKTVAIVLIADAMSVKSLLHPLKKKKIL